LIVARQVRVTVENEEVLAQHAKRPTYSPASAQKLFAVRSVAHAQAKGGTSPDDLLDLLGPVSHAQHDISNSARSQQLELVGHEGLAAYVHQRLGKSSSVMGRKPGG